MDCYPRQHLLLAREETALAVLITLATINTSDAYDPNQLIADASGDLFGATEYGGAVFEIAKTESGYATTPNILASLNSSGDYQPVGGLIVNAYGDLFGTDVVDSTLFEVANTASGYASTPTTLVSFNGSGLSHPVGGLITDANGDLFGVTEYGGGNGNGAAFEIANTSNGYASTPTVLVSFNSTVVAGLIADANGDLFGTTTTGGADGDGTVFEIAKTASGYASTPATLVSFNATDGTMPETGLILDANGDLFGTTTAGGVGGDGTVFEIAKTASGYASTPTTLVSFSGSDGADPIAGLNLDASGDLFGTTASGGASNDGTVFEIANTPSGYASTPTTLVSFNGGDGSQPDTGLIADASGDLFGDTGTGGTVFEVKDTGYAVACYCRGTMILTTRGEVAVEDLAIGDVVVTAGGASEPVRWIGRRSYAGRFIGGDHLMLPITIHAGALADGVPHTDLRVSPGHAMWVDDHFVPAWRLVNGVTVTQADFVEEVTYFHVELDTHDLLLANGAPAESFLDKTGFRGQFQNAAEFAVLYPNAIPLSPMKARLEDGFALQRIQDWIAARAGTFATVEPAGSLRGYVDQAGPERVSGWAQDLDSPEEPVELEITVDGAPAFTVLANAYRSDLRKAGIGSGCHAFSVLLPSDFDGRVTVRRVADGAVLEQIDAAEQMQRVA